MQIIRRLLRDTTGAALVESTVVVALMLLLVFGLVDMALYMFQSNAASKATQLGARWAVVNRPVSNPFVQDLADTSWWPVDKLGTSCETLVCGPTVERTCTGSQSDCDPAGMDALLTAMRRALPDLEDTEISITYRSHPPNRRIGFVGRPGGPPVDVIVEVRCRRVDFVFLDTWFDFWGTPTADCPGTGMRIPRFRAVLSSESFGNFY